MSCTSKLPHTFLFDGKEWEINVLCFFFFFDKRDKIDVLCHLELFQLLILELILTCQSWRTARGSQRDGLLMSLSMPCLAIKYSCSKYF